MNLCKRWPKGPYIITLLMGAALGGIICSLHCQAQLSYKGPRKANYPVDKLIISRWSPRAMSGQELTTQELMSLFEAARWAPSSYNNQPWRFIYATKQSPEWEKFFNLLVPFNQSWARNAGALVVVLSTKNAEHDNEPMKTHSFDTGAAVENMALQASSMGLVMHVMEGFNETQARTNIDIPDTYAIEVMIALGKPGDKRSLPQGIQERETPSERKPLSDLVFVGSLKNPAT